MPISIEARIQKYNAWRQRREVPRALTGLLWEPDIPPLPEMLAQTGSGNAVSPAQIRPELFLPSIERWYQQDLRLETDAIQPFTPAFGIPWVEAIAGCRVVAQPGALWAEPTLSDYRERRPIVLERNNPWLVSLLAFTRELVRFSAGRFPVALPQMRGPLDTLAALRTPAQMCLDCIEQPEEVCQILAELTQVWIEVAELVLDEIPAYHGGWCTRMKMWSPGRAVTPQNDVCTLISPGMYRAMISPLDRKIFAHFPYHSFHMHSTEYRHIPGLLDAPELTAIQFTLEQDAGGPPLEKMLAEAEKILAKKPLILVPMDVQTAEICLERLPPAGLAVMVGLNTPQIPIEIQDWLAAHCQEK